MKIKLLFFIFIFLFFVISLAFATTYYVSPNGNDSNTSVQAQNTGTPWKTISHAVSQAVANDIIKVMDDNDAGTVDYTENITVDKTLTIERYDSDSTLPWIKPSNFSNPTFTLTADYNEIAGLKITGNSAGDQADYGVHINDALYCEITDNSILYHTRGIFIEKTSTTSKYHIISGNTCDYNHVGLYVYESSHNKVYDNSFSHNGASGIYVAHYSSYNTFSYNTCNNNSTNGISTGEGCGNNNISANTFNSNTDYGVHISTTSGASNANNIISGNTINSNGTGVFFDTDTEDFVFYLNSLSSNSTSVNKESGSTGTCYSLTKLGYNYNGSSYKNYMGNYFSDYSGSDSDGDGIGDTNYSCDDYPLISTPDNFSLQTWWLSNPVMYQGDMSKIGNRITFNTSSSQIWTADQPALEDISFNSGNQSSATSWTGQLTFVSVPVIGNTFIVEIGYASDQYGTSFWTNGPEVTITADGAARTFLFTTNAVAFDILEGKYLAMRITNNSTENIYDLRVGGSWSYCSAPENSEDYTLPVELSSFSAVLENNIPVMYWTTQSETENLGWNIYRSQLENGFENGNYIQINNDLIEGMGTVSYQTDYSFCDPFAIDYQTTYWYWLESISYSNELEIYGPISLFVSEPGTTLEIPERSFLNAAYPNPFNPQTTICFGIGSDEKGSLSIYNVLGQIVHKKAFESGLHEFIWNAEKQASGVYFYRLETENYFATKKIILIK